MMINDLVGDYNTSALEDVSPMELARQSPPESSSPVPTLSTRLKSDSDEKQSWARVREGADEVHGWRLEGAGEVHGVKRAEKGCSRQHVTEQDKGGADEVHGM